MKLYSTPVETVILRIKEVAPAMDISAPAPREEIMVNKRKTNHVEGEISTTA